MPDSSETRDMAMKANIKVDAHIDDCIRFRAQLSKQSDETNEKIETLCDKITGLQIKLSVALGVLFFASKIVDYILLWKGVK